MNTQKLQKILEVIAERLDAHEVPFALIGAFALGIYGVPRYTVDIDLLADYRNQKELVAILEDLDFQCSQKTDVFIQFDSELGVYGQVDCMFVQTRDGREILKRRVMVNDGLMGKVPVVEPTDFIVLKMMAMANQPGRSAGDESDIRAVLNCYRVSQIPSWFGPLDRERIHKFSQRFGQQHIIKKIFEDISETTIPGDKFIL